MKNSVKKTFYKVFILEFAAVIILCALFTYYNVRNQELKEMNMRAHSAASITASLISDKTFDALLNPMEVERYNLVRERLRAVCKSLSLQYLYLYTVEENTIFYIMTVAGDDEEDSYVAEERGFGVEIDSSLLEKEKLMPDESEDSKPIYYTNQFGTLASWYVPYKDQNGNVRAVIGVDISYAVERGEIVKNFLITLLVILVILLPSRLVILLLVRRRLISPILKISDSMDRFDPGKENEPLKFHTQDEIQQIADSFEKMSGDIYTYIENNEKLMAERGSQKAQLDIARRIQQGMVPAEFHKETDTLEVSAMMHPAKEVGGDFYDCFITDSKRLCMVIGDVSGKGVAAALFMSMVKSRLRENLKRDDRPALVLNKVNDDVCAENPEGLFATVFVVVFDPETGDISYGNAGHNPPLLLTREGPRYMTPQPGIVLGLFEDAGIIEDHLSLKPGEGILLYTDGITEAVNAQNAFYGTDRLAELLGKQAYQDTGSLISGVEQDVWYFYAGREQFDDMTAVALLYKGSGKKDAQEWELSCDLAAFGVIKEWMLRECSMAPGIKRIILACEEAFVNIVSYSGARTVWAAASTEEDTLRVVFKDDGIRFDPFTEGIRATKDFEDYDGGMGIKMILRFAEQADYRYEEGKNVLTMCFSLTDDLS